MKKRWLCFIIILVLAGLLGRFSSRSPSAEERALEKTRLDLKAAGFKVSLAEFDFSTSPAERQRAAALLWYATNSYRPMSSRELPDLANELSSNSVEVIWQSPAMGALSLEDTQALFPPELDTVVADVSAAPIRFDLDARAGVGMLLRHLSGVRSAAQALAVRAMLRLSQKDSDAAWTNLFALTRLVTAYQPEPVEVSQLLRYNLIQTAFQATWQALQFHGWSDAQLLHLQQEWETAELFKGWPETAAFSRAALADACRREREEPRGGSGLSLAMVLRHPLDSWRNFQYENKRRVYRHHGSYEDEKDWLLFFRDRELELKRAVQAGTWREMQQLPGVTNFTVFKSRHGSSVQSLWNSRQLALRLTGRGQVPLACAAAAEAQRRLLITAIALERFRDRTGRYPSQLNELVPRELLLVPVDFMAGQPLHYAADSDAGFTLYGLGLDGVDHGGQFGPKQKPASFDPPIGTRVQGLNANLIWPRPATPKELEAHRQGIILSQQQKEEERRDAIAEDQWRRSAQRQSRVDAILAAGSRAPAAEPQYRGRPLTETLANRAVLGTNRLSFAELLTLHPLRTGEEPEVVAFELPIAYDTLTNLGELSLFIDPDPKDDSDEGCRVGQLECERATNGNCRLVWTTIYESPGRHALQAGVELSGARAGGPLAGPWFEYTVTNLCQFSLVSATFTPELGATLSAKLPEARASYVVELSAPNGAILRTLTGRTSNGILRVHWDLNDDRGQRCTNHAFGSLFKVTLTESGRYQAQKGP